MQTAVRIDCGEIDDDAVMMHYYRSNLNNNFPISNFFNFHDFTDSFAKLAKYDKNRIHINRVWGQKSSNIFNMKKLCAEILDPICVLNNCVKVEIQMGILDKVLIDAFGLGTECMMWFGKAVMFKSKNTFSLFQKILISKIKFGELIYFVKKDLIYITLPTVIMKDIVKIKN